MGKGERGEEGGEGGVKLATAKPVEQATRLQQITELDAGIHIQTLQKTFVKYPFFPLSVSTNVRRYKK